MIYTLWNECEDVLFCGFSTFHAQKCSKSASNLINLTHLQKWLRKSAKSLLYKLKKLRNSELGGVSALKSLKSRVTWLTHSLTHSLSEWQGHLLSCPGQLTTKGKWGKFIINMSDSFDFACLSVLSVWHCLNRFSFTVGQRERKDKEEEKSYKKHEQARR